MKSLWETLWDYDPNGLIVLNEEMKIKVVNPAFCRMFQMEREELIGRNAEEILDDVTEFSKVLNENIERSSIEQEYPRYHLYVRNVIFPIPDENIVACIMVDLKREQEQRNEMIHLKREAILKVKRVVDKQMSVAQEIAGLLGETTAETKVSLLKLLEMLEQES
jgi:PAS domain S-box-containing protein